ncbi:MAG: hypothetical protein R2799_03475 [Crocinitomicaceae bacterium]
MKKIIFAVALVSAFTFNYAGNGEGEKAKVEAAEYKGGKLTIHNDTDDEVRVHTGYGETTLSARGGKTTVTCAPGKKVKAEGKVIFEVTADMCGTTVKLSDYL